MATDPADKGWAALRRLSIPTATLCKWSVCKRMLRVFPHIRWSCVLDGVMKDRDHRLKACVYLSTLPGEGGIGNVRNLERRNLVRRQFGTN